MTALLTETTQDLTSRLGEELKRQEGTRLRREDVRHLVGSAYALAGIILAEWKWVCETLDGEGFEGRELAEHCQVLLEGITGSLAAYEPLRALAVAAELTLEAASLPELEAKLAGLREIQPRIAAALDLVHRPARSPDAALLANSEDALQRGEFVTLDDDYLARLRANGIL